MIIMKYSGFSETKAGMGPHLNSLLKSCCLGGLALSLGATSLALAAEPPKAKAKPQQPTQAASQPSQSHPVTQAAVRSGVLACAGRIDQVANFLTAGSQSGAFLFVPNGQQDRQVFSTSMEIASPNAPLAYASASFAPNQANGCGALYETVVFWPASCEEVAAKQYASLKAGAKLGKRTTVLVLGPSSRVFLMPAADRGCISIKKEIVQ